MLAKEDQLILSKLRKNNLCSLGFSNKCRGWGAAAKEQGSHKGKQGGQCKDTGESAKALAGYRDGTNEGSQWTLFPEACTELRKQQWMVRCPATSNLVFLSLGLKGPARINQSP